MSVGMGAVSVFDDSEPMNFIELFMICARIENDSQCSTYECSSISAKDF